MNRSLKGKMILSYLAVALLTVLVVSALIRLTSNRTLMNLVVEEQTASLKVQVQEYYTANGSLDGFFNAYIQSNPYKPPPQQGNSYDKGPEQQSRDIRGLVGLVDPENIALMPTMGFDMGMTIPEDRIKEKISVEVEGRTVAWILPDTAFEFRLSPQEEQFLQRSTLAIGLAALAGVLVALGIGFFLAGQLLKPIRLLTKASKSLSQGNLDQRVPVTSKDELGELTATFNQMSTDLVQADQQRKRLTADITHDLSTPLQIISGYIEMLEEGGVTLTPQRIEIIKTEIEHLRRLVGDLTTLSQVEAGGLEMQVEPVRPAALLDCIYQAFEPIASRQGVKLSLDAAHETPLIQVDEGRIEQVLMNLLENALRYTPQDGVIELGARADERVHLWVRDSGAGIDAEDLPYVFDRFYRADKARAGSSGKMGLGLAICKALVTAHGGTISAESAGKDLGSTMTISFEPVKIKNSVS
ncbi:MAG: sensor histidine kinase [Anaerolineaceae bacterium]